MSVEATTAGSSQVRHRVGRAEDFPPGCAKLVTVGRLEVGVFNVDGELHAYRNYCPHRAAPVCLGRVGGTMLPADRGEFIIVDQGKVLMCPWHRWEFDLTTGRTVFELDRRRLIRYSVVREGDEVFVSVPARLVNGA